MGSRRADLALVLVFLAVIALPLATNLAGHDGGDETAENRKLAPAPTVEWTTKGLAALPGTLTAWFEDHFGFRSTLVRWYGESRYRLLGVSPTPTVIAGRNGWLFYADDGGTADFTNERLLSPGELRLWIAATDRAGRWLERRGVSYVFTIAPGKSHIYGDEMPASLHPVTATSRTDQVVGALSGHVRADVVNPELALADARTREPDPIYFKTDTHWNDRGAFVAYQQIIETVRQRRPDVGAAWTADDFERTAWTVEGQDLAGMMGLTHTIHETEYSLTPKRPRQARVVEPAGVAPASAQGRLVTEIPGSHLPRAVIFRDSFGSRLVPFLSEHFSRAVYLWQNDFDAEVVIKEHPDVVIQEIVSRHLYTFLPSPELVPQ